MKKIKFTISPVGAVKLEAEGISGQSCKEFTKPFEDKLGATPENSETQLKDEFYHAEETSQEQGMTY